MVDAVVIGGGFYGSVIADYLVRRRCLSDVVLLEREPDLLRRASFNNQARVHNGYHYPRSYTTAVRSRINLPRFVSDYPEVIANDFTKIYAIARAGSKVTAKQFVRFCHQIGAHWQPAPVALKGLFDKKLIEDVFVVEEFAFDANRLRDRVRDDMADSGVQVFTNARVTGVRSAPAAKILVEYWDGAGGEKKSVLSRYVFNCTYSSLNQLTGDFPGTLAKLKHEITEMALIELPESLNRLGVTVMDGPFFSLMPFPPRGMHTLSHVRYTPHCHWVDNVCIDPHAVLGGYEKASRFERMRRDAARLLPAIENARYADALFEVKTVLVKNEGDDGRPILFERSDALPGCYSVLGGKIDNIYDVLERLDAEQLSARGEK